jgi:hypothetical protein
MQRTLSAFLLTHAQDRVHLQVNKTAPDGGPAQLFPEGLFRADRKRAFGAPT